MEIEYIVEDNSVKVTINGVTEIIPYDDLLDSLPRELIRDYHLINEISKVRERIVKQIGDFNDYIIVLLAKQKQVREKMETLDPVNDTKAINSYAKIMKAISDEKNTSRELRHGVRLLSNEEGRYLAEIEKLEV